MQIFIPFNFEVDDSDRLLENAKDTWIDEAGGCTIYSFRSCRQIHLAVIRSYGYKLWYKANNQYLNVY